MTQRIEYIDAIKGLAIILVVMGHVLACSMVFHFFMNGISLQIQHVLSYFGKKSLAKYILHILFVIQFVKIGDFILAQNAVTSVTVQIVYSLSVSSVAILLSLITYKILNSSPLIGYMLFGQKKQILKS